MPLFRRRKPLHEQLAEAGGFALAPDTGAAPGLSAQPPGWDGAPRGEPGIHGVPQARRWETVASAEAPGLKVDGRPTLGSARGLERLGEAEGTEYVVQARRLDGDLWEVEATAL